MYLAVDFQTATDLLSNLLSSVSGGQVRTLEFGDRRGTYRTTP